eukprot:6211670-Pyramimonas_sp.AAC.1
MKSKNAHRETGRPKRAGGGAPGVTLEDIWKHRRPSWSYGAFGGRLGVLSGLLRGMSGPSWGSLGVL